MPRTRRAPPAPRASPSSCRRRHDSSSAVAWSTPQDELIVRELRRTFARPRTHAAPTPSRSRKPLLNGLVPHYGVGVTERVDIVDLPRRIDALPHGVDVAVEVQHVRLPAGAARAAAEDVHLAAGRMT